MNEASRALSKVPAVTLTFWIIKIAATTLGETGGDTVSMTLNLGYLLSTGIFLAVLILLVSVQISARRFRPLLYWATIIASTTAGTTLADFADRSLGIGYLGGTLLLLSCVLGSLALWYRTEGSVSVSTVNTPRVEGFYWATITFSQTLGTALGDWAADAGLGYGGGALLFGAALALVAVGVPSHPPLARAAVLGGLHPDAPPRGDPRGLLRQAARAGWPWHEPAARLGGARNLRAGLRALAAAARGGGGGPAGRGRALGKSPRTQVAERVGFEPTNTR